MVLRDRKDPGPEHGRPLTVPTPGLWHLDNNYLKPKPATSG